jgi:hypothetical protein
VKPCLWTLVVVWGAWSTCVVVSSAIADASAGHTGTIAAYLAWVIGFPVAVVVSVIACAVIASDQCLTALLRRRARR